MRQRTTFALGSRLPGPPLARAGAGKALGKSPSLQPPAYSLEPSLVNANSLSGIKVAISCSGLEHVRRGVEAWSQEAFLGLRERGVDVTLFKGSGSNGLAQVSVVPCIRRESRLSQALTKALPSWGWRVGFGSSYQMEQTTFAVNLLAAVGRRFDLLHTKDPQVALLMHRANRAGMSRAKVILNHGTEEPPEFLKRFDYIQHLAPFHRDEALRQGVRAKRQFAIPNLVDTDKFSPGSGTVLRQRLGIPQEAFVILCVAAIKRHHKRIDWLLQEVARVPQEVEVPIHLLIVGAKTSDTESLGELGAQLLGERVHVLIDHSHNDMPEVYRAADLFVLCSLKEMLASARLEALASGVPCLMHREPVAEWVVGEGGALVDMTVPGALAEAIGRLRQPQLRAAMAARARAQAVARFSKSSVLDQQLAMYEQVMGSS